MGHDRLDKKVERTMGYCTRSKARPEFVVGTLTCAFAVVFRFLCYALITVG